MVHQSLPAFHDGLEQRRGAVVTLAYFFISGTLLASVVGWLVVPMWLPVEYLTPIVVSGPSVGLLLGQAALWSYARPRR